MTNKKISIAIAVVIILFSRIAQTQSLSTEQWQQDLDHLQRKLHAEYSMLFSKWQKADFDSAVSTFRKSIPTLTPIQIKVGFIKLMAGFRIGHTGVYFMEKDNTGGYRPMFKYFPVTLYPFEDGMYIKSIDARYKEAVGGKLVRIGSVDVESALERLKEVIPMENTQHFKANVSYYFRLAEILNVIGVTRVSNLLTLTYMKDGITHSVAIKAEDAPEQFWHSPELEIPQGWVDMYNLTNSPAAMLWLRHPGQKQHIEYLKEFKTVYVRHSAVQDLPHKSLAHFFDEVFSLVESNDVEKLVVDLRLNPGGNNYLNKKVITGIIEQRKINRYGHLFVVIGPTTFSAAQNLTNELEKYTEAIFVGEPTGENVNYWGDVKSEELPNSKMIIKISWLWWQNMDPRDKRPWTPPHLHVPLTAGDYQSGKDPVMDLILGFHEEKSIYDTIDSLLFQVNSLPDAVHAAKSFLALPVNRYNADRIKEVNFDKAIGFWVQNKIADAGKLFGLNVQLFPLEPSVHEVYAEWLLMENQKEKAVIHLQTAIDLDPGGEVAASCRKTLEKIRQENRTR